MPRPSSKPPFPNSPGSWLANYRFRGKGEDGLPLSRQSLGELLGASVQTVRRWEMGLSRPSDVDLEHFGAICGLNSFEIEFLVTAFHSREGQSAPGEAEFRRWANETLSLDFPGIIMDGLFYIRAWNEYFAKLFPAVYEFRLPWHIFDLWRANRTILRNREELFGSWMRELWWASARFCGSEPYIHLLDNLCEIPMFRDAWLGTIAGPSSDAPIGLPHQILLPGGGAMRVFTSRVVFPPSYHLRGYMPIDKKAYDVMEGLRNQHEPKVYVDSLLHWSHTEK